MMKRIAVIFRKPKEYLRLKKIGRNDPCPCGSGKKFKKCCIDIYGKGYRPQAPVTSTRKSEFTTYLEQHESGHILNCLTTLQLIPENYGKNYRIEVMAIEAVKALSKGNPGNIHQLKSIILKEFPSHYAEDLPEGLFTENVLFHGGNYIVMPGLNTNATDIFNYLTQVIYTTQNEFPQQLKDELYQGIVLMLSIGELIFGQAQLKRNSFVANHDKELKIPSDQPRLSFNQNELDKICEINGINPQTINQFITQPDAPEFNYNDPSLSPLLFRPIVGFGGEYHFVLPSGQMSAINEFIIQTSKEFGIRRGLNQLCHSQIWRDTWGACDKMDWKLTDINLPALENDSLFKERIFQIDINMLAYVIYAFPHDIKGAFELHEEKISDLLGGDFLDKRTQEVISNLKSRSELEGFQFLTLILTNTMGGFSAFGISDPQEDEQKVWFNIFDFILLARAEEWERLDLWKYAKVYESTTRETRIMVTSSIDAYAAYSRNDQTFYLSDERQASLLTIVPGDGADKTREAKMKMDIHGALCLDNGSMSYLPVTRLHDYAPIYKPILNRINYEMLLESYDFPVWVQNYQVKTRQDSGAVDIISDAICFWLHSLHPALRSVFEQADLAMLNIVLEFDQTYFELLPSNPLDASESINFQLDFSFIDNHLTCRFPKNFRKIFIGGDNRGERVLMFELLKGFNEISEIELSDEYISDSIDHYIPLGQAKMILIIDSRIDMKLDNRWLLPPFYISDAEINLLLDKLVEIVNSPNEIPEKFDTVKQKKTFCNQTVLKLIQYLMQRLAAFDNETTIERLIHLNESLIYIRSNRNLRTSAEIYCFGNDENKLKKVLSKERKQVSTSLSVRCLIEFIALRPAGGSRIPSFDHLDELLSVMNEILNYGMLSDVLHFRMADPEMGLLPSGRIGISREFFDEKLHLFKRDNVKANIEAQLDFFSTKFGSIETRENNSESDAFLEKVNAAFLSDWGVSYTNLHNICMHSAALAANQENSVVSMLEKDFVNELNRTIPGVPDEIEQGLGKLRFENDPSIINSKIGYANKDFYPWKYNRDHSYARRPLIVVNSESGRKYYWGMRHCVSASHYLNQLLHSGRITHGGPKISSLNGMINKDNGKQFRNIVFKWLQDNTKLRVWDHEVTMKVGGHFDADKDYGDCDILAYDELKNEVYNIECKLTDSARNIYQMKKEMDSYLGRMGQKKKIAKHAERDKWLQSNLNQVQAFVSTRNQPSVKSLIITSELIPTRYLRAEEIPIPIFSFGEVKQGTTDISTSSLDS